MPGGGGWLVLKLAGAIEVAPKKGEKTQSLVLVHVEVFRLSITFYDASAGEFRGYLRSPGSIIT